jgi:hypothetical protein
MAKRTAVGQEVQRIGLGFVKESSHSSGVRRSPRHWLGRRLERMGRRLQHATAQPNPVPARKYVTVRG